MNREVMVNRFLAQTDNGKRYTIFEYQEYIPAASLPHPNAEIPSLKRWDTSTGRHVNNIDSETFQIVEADEVVRKV